jgi:hypothetical protein
VIPNSAAQVANWILKQNIIKNEFSFDDNNAICFNYGFHNLWETKERVKWVICEWERNWDVLCAAVGTARHQHWLAACTVCGDRTVCSCRYSKTSALVSSMYCVWYICTTLTIRWLYWNQSALKSTAILLTFTHVSTTTSCFVSSATMAVQCKILANYLNLYRTKVTFAVTQVKV